MHDLIAAGRVPSAGRLHCLPRALPGSNTVAPIVAGIAIEVAGSLTIKAWQRLDAIVGSTSATMRATEVETELFCGEGRQAEVVERPLGGAGPHALVM